MRLWFKEPLEIVRKNMAVKLVDQLSVTIMALNLEIHLLFQKEYARPASVAEWPNQHSVYGRKWHFACTIFPNPFSGEHKHFRIESDHIRLHSSTFKTMWSIKHLMLVPSAKSQTGPGSDTLSLKVHRQRNSQLDSVLHGIFNQSLGLLPGTLQGM